MRVNIPLRQDVISVPQEFAFLDVERSFAGNRAFYVYQIKYSVNGLLAIKNKATIVKIQLSRRLPNRAPDPVVNDVETPTGLSGIDPYGVINSIRVRSQEVKDAIRANRNDFFFLYPSDWTAFVSNEKTDNIHSGLKTGATTISYKTIRSVINSDIQSLVAANNIPPILATQATLPRDNISVSDNMFRSLSEEMLFLDRIHPAEMYSEKQNSIITTQKKSTGTKTSLRKSRVVQENTGAAMLEGALNSYGTVEPLTHQSVPQNSVVSIPVIAEETMVYVTEQLEIPTNLVGTFPFYVVFDLVDSKGNLVQRETRLIEHGKNYAAAATPKSAPVIHATSAELGRNIVEVEEAGKGFAVNLYRKIEYTSTVNNDAAYTFVGKVTFQDMFNKKARVYDLCDNYNPVVYRAIPVGEDGSLGANFATATTTAPSLPVGMNVPSLNKRKFAAMSHEIIDAGVKLTIKDIPAGTIELQLLRKDFTEEGAPERPVGRKMLLDNMQSEVVMADKSVYKDRIYEYRCQFTDRFGNTDEGSTVMVVEYTPEISTFIATVINDPRGVQGTELDITFKLETNTVLGDEDQLRKALESQGLLAYFGNSVTQERLQQLVAYNVVRTNLNSGEVEDFGVVVDKNFSDVAVGRPKGVTPLRNGDTYKYTVTTLLRDPNTSLRGITIDAVDPTYPNKQNRKYTYQPYYWQHPVALKKGTLVTDETIQVITSKTDFLLGEVGSLAMVTVSLENFMPGVIEPVASKVSVSSPTTIRISWRVTGLATKFDHFIVMQEHLGMVTRIGCCHNITSNNTFEFFDELTNEETGEIGYLIIPIYYDYSIGKSINTNKVVV